MRNKEPEKLIFYMLYKQDSNIYREIGLARTPYSYSCYNKPGRSSKSDSAPVRGEVYKPTGLRTQQSQRRDVAQLRVGGGGG